MSDDLVQSTLAKLRIIREKKDITIRPTPFLRKTLVGLDGVEKPLSLRYYQVQMVLHLMAMKRFIVGDDTGLGKCVSPDTCVKTDIGWVPIGEIVPKDMGSDEFRPATGDHPKIILMDGSETTIKAYYYGGNKPTIKITTEQGYVLEGSHKHRVWQCTDNEGCSWKTLPEIKIGDQVFLDGSFKIQEDSSFFYDKISTIEHGHSDLMDIEVNHPDHYYIGNGFVNHNTLESIASTCYIFEKDPEAKVLILTKKSALRQWVDEINRFTVGVNTIVCKGNPKQRQAARDAFVSSSGPTVLVMGHRSAVQDFAHLQDIEWGIFILDEATVAKSPSTQMHQVCRHLSAKSQRAWGLTATLIKNNLVEGYGIFRVVEPELFKHTPAAFIDDYCVTQTINVGRGKKVKQIVGYRRADVQRFRDKIEPYYLGRPKHEVATELPLLTSRRVPVGMSPIQAAKYQEALAGLLEIGTGEEKEVSKLTAVTYCQEIVNHPGLIGIEGTSEKLDELVDILTEGDLAGEKVIIFTRFSKMVDIGIAELKKHKVECLRITGAEDEDERKTAQDTFQNHNSKVQVIWITTAGSDAINLQAAKAIVFYDTPFSAGDYLQVIGRMLRIGSIHDRVYALHLVTENSVDERVMDVMDAKMGLLEAVLGKRVKGEGDEEVIEAGTSPIDALFDSLRKDARGGLIRG